MHLFVAKWALRNNWVHVIINKTNNQIILKNIQQKQKRTIFKKGEEAKVFIWISLDTKNVFCIDMRIL